MEILGWPYKAITYHRYLHAEKMALCSGHHDSFGHNSWNLEQYSRI
jgi:hypothetical protein